MKKHITNNKGFSLVELLVAIAIFVIVAGPLLYSFIVSQRVMNKSHFMGEATLISRNVIERVKANGVQNILFNVDSGTSPFTAGSSVGSVIVWDEPSGEYEFIISDLEGGTLEQTDAGPSGLVLYDAVVRIDALPYTVFNELEMSEYSPMDAMFVQPRDADDPDEEAIAEFISEITLRDLTDLPEGAIPPPPPDPDDLEGRYSRSITMDVKKVDTNVTMTVTFEYEYTHSVHGTLGHTIDYDMYYESYDGTSPLSAYLFYRPYYSDPSVPGISPDTIIINNMDRLNLTVFVVKQKPVGMTDANVSTYAPQEANYKARIYQLEHPAQYGSGPRTKVYTNFKVNFTGAPQTPVNFDHRAWYSGSVGTGFATPITTDDMLVAQSARMRMYDVTVDVYMQGEALTGDPLYTYTASNLD